MEQDDEKSEEGWVIEKIVKVLVVHGQEVEQKQTALILRRLNTW